MRSIAFINEKGGTGKTTLAVNLGAYLAMMAEKRVLLCDLDTQGHSSKALGLEAAWPDADHLRAAHRFAPAALLDTATDRHPRPGPTTGQQGAVALPRGGGRGA